MKASEQKIQDYMDNPKAAIEQLESCEYESIGGFLVNNVAFIALKRLAEKQKIKTQSHCPHNAPWDDCPECRH